MGVCRSCECPEEGVAFSTSLKSREKIYVIPNLNHTISYTELETIVKQRLDIKQPIEIYYPLNDRRVLLSSTVDIETFNRLIHNTHRRNPLFIRIVSLDPQIKQRNDLVTKLTSINLSDVHVSTLNDFSTLAKVVKVYDGDTITVSFFHNKVLETRNFRMFGYDSPELHPRKTIEHRDLHMQAGQKARDVLHKLLELRNNIVWIEFCKEEKYGRAMGTVYLLKDNKTEYKTDNILVNVNTWMQQNGLGKIYMGKTKEEFTVDELNSIINKTYIYPV